MLQAAKNPKANDASRDVSKIIEFVCDLVSDALQHLEMVKPSYVQISSNAESQTARLQEDKFQISISISVELFASTQISLSERKVIWLWS